MKKATIQRVRFFVTLVHEKVSKLLQHFDVNNVEITCVRHVASLSIKRVKAFAFHTIVDLRSDITEINTTTDVGNCLVHSNRSIEVYCFDNEELGCSFCLTTKHKDCKTVLSWDEVAENDLENLSKSFKRETKQIRDLNTSAFQDTKKNKTELTQKKMKYFRTLA